MKYSEFLELLEKFSEEKFAEFQRRLIPTKQKILGVRTPIMRKLAKEYKGDTDTLFSYPDEYFEVTFIKLTVASLQPFETFLKLLGRCVSLMDNWATCDCFKAKCIAKNKDAFLPVLKRVFEHGGEFYERYALVVLLSDYVEEKYLPVIEEYIGKADTSAYYIHMAVAWLIAEILIKYYDFGLKLLKKRITDIKTHNKAIQKAVESYRLTKDQKEYLRSLKIKKEIR